MKTCLVTGGCGFIGSNLVKQLHKDGWLIDVADNLSFGSLKNLNGINVNIIQDNFDSPQIINNIQNKKYSIIFHLAAIPSVAYSVEHPSLTTDINLASTVRLFEAARGNVKRIVFSSSAAVYGNEYAYSVSPSFAKSPSTPYAWQKASIEDAAKIFGELYDIDIVSLRYFNVYGHGQNGSSSYSTIISAWLDCVKNNKPLRLDGTGDQSRDFIHVDDVVNANILAANYNYNLHGKSFNISTNISTTCNQILQYFQDYFGQLKIKNMPERKGDIKLSKGMYNNCIGFKPQINFAEGILKTFNAFDKDNNE